MGTARVTFPMVVVMITPDIGVEVQLACCQCFCCCISVAGNTTIKPDTHIAQCHLGTAANTAADQGIHLQCTQDACQCTMSAAASIHNLRRNDFSIFHIVDFKLFGVTLSVYESVHLYAGGWLQLGCPAGQAAEVCGI